MKSEFRIIDIIELPLNEGFCMFCGHGMLSRKHVYEIIIKISCQPSPIRLCDRCFNKFNYETSKQALAYKIKDL